MAGATYGFAKYGTSKYGEGETDIVTTPFTANGTWTAPSGVTEVSVQTWGAGGSGGGGVALSQGNAGGGGGAFAAGRSTVVPGTGYTVTVGVGGTSVGGSSIGAAGGDSWFKDAATVMAKGGAGGTINGLATDGGSEVLSVGDVRWKGGRGATRTGGNGGGGGGGAGSTARNLSANPTGNGNDGSGINGGAATAEGGGAGGLGGNPNAVGGSTAGGGGGGGSSITPSSGPGANGEVRVYHRPPSDTTPPLADVLSGPSVARMSRVAGKDQADFVFEANEAISAWQVRIVPSSSSPVTAGTLIESGGALAAGEDASVTITDDEFVAAGATDGTHVVKVFAQDAAGNWST